MFGKPVRSELTMMAVIEAIIAEIKKTTVLESVKATIHMERDRHYVAIVLDKDLTDEVLSDVCSYARTKWEARASYVEPSKTLHVVIYDKAG